MLCPWQSPVGMAPACWPSLGRWQACGHHPGPGGWAGQSLGSHIWTHGLCGHQPEACFFKTTSPRTPYHRESESEKHLNSESLGREHQAKYSHLTAGPEDCGPSIWFSVLQQSWPIFFHFLKARSPLTTLWIIQIRKMISDFQNLKHRKTVKYFFPWSLNLALIKTLLEFLSWLSG